MVGTSYEELLHFVTYAVLNTVNINEMCKSFQYFFSVHTEYFIPTKSTSTKDNTP